VSSGRLDRDGRLALLALGALLAVTVAWWVLALWPVPGETPEWLTRAREVCFNADADGMPDVTGWMLLIGQPVVMFGFLAVVWPRPVGKGLGWLAGRNAGRMALAGVGALVVGGLVATGIRVGEVATARAASIQLPPGMPAANHPRLDRPAPALGLVDQRGEAVELEALLGRPALVTFAFGHCGDICPLVVDNARRARDEAWGPEGAALVVVTLDPWRDTPARLPDLAARWQLGPADHLLSGSVDEVEAVLDAWNMARDRNPMTGDIAHPPLLYLLDARGTIVFATLSGRATIVELAERMSRPTGG
jgi:cytochrome oxidase Cu insertion factor (SCO1/SenC/PrrC family)